MARVQVSERLNALIATCVIKGITFEGKVGTFYNVQDLVQILGRKTLNTMYQRTKKQLDSLDTDSLFESANTAKRNKLKLQSDTIQEVFNYKTELEKAERNAIKEEENKAERLATLKKVLAEKEIEAVKGTDIDALKAEIEALEK